MQLWEISFFTTRKHGNHGTRKLLGRNHYTSPSFLLLCLCYQYSIRHSILSLSLSLFFPFFFFFFFVLFRIEKWLQVGCIFPVHHLSMAKQCSLSDVSKQMNLNIPSFLLRLTCYKVASVMQDIILFSWDKQLQRNRQYAQTFSYLWHFLGLAVLMLFMMSGIIKDEIRDKGSNTVK